jgi:hypothetical protein
MQEALMNRTQRFEEAELERVLYEESHAEPRYPLIERPELAQLSRTAIEFTEFDSEGNYMELQ